MESEIRNIFKFIGENPDREGLIDTPHRIVKMWKEIYKGYLLPPPKVTTFKNGSDGIIYDQMIFDSGEFYSTCEHHMLPFFGKYYFAYIPNSNGKILGLSKVSRVVDYFSSRMQIQERLTCEVVEYLWGSLSDMEFPPVGMMLVMEGEHLCKTMRGAKNKGKMKTSYIKGLFKENGARNEFLSFMKTVE